MAMYIERYIEELTAQADDADLMGDFLAGRLVRSSEPADVSELPVPDADEVESAGWSRRRSGSPRTSGTSLPSWRSSAAPMCPACCESESITRSRPPSIRSGS